MNIRSVAVVAFGLLAAAPACADPITGLVGRDGSVAVSSSLYTVSHIGPGHYVITFATPMLPQASCVITTTNGQDPNVYVSRLIETDSSCEIVTGNNGHRFDTRFSFIALPMSN
ncbi:MAG: hypothetical protein JOZ72_05395 [Alphaproteobacteria bacterium]|nr:hypothetical protein [Alphaproteobacteria bacterium]